MKTELINLIVVMNPGETAHVSTVENFSLETLQKLVGGCIERLGALPNEFASQRVIGYVNEEARLKGLRRNTLGILGPIVVTGLDKSGESVGLTKPASGAVMMYLNRRR